MKKFIIPFATMITFITMSSFSSEPEPGKIDLDSNMTRVSDEQINMQFNKEETTITWSTQDESDLMVNDQFHADLADMLAY